MKSKSPFQRANWLSIIVLALALFFSREQPAAAAVINLQPHSTNVLAGSNATFNVVAGGQAPISYRWSFNGTNLPDGGSFSGITNATLTISNVATANAGDYCVVVSDSDNVVTSAVATLTVLLPPAVATQPLNQYVLSGGSATFAVTATGDAPLSYHWLLNGVPLSDTSRVSGTTTNRMTIQNVQSVDTGSYWVVISNAWGSITSSVAALNLATVRYVNASNSSPVSPYTSWVTAATVIQDAVDVATDGDLILATNGIYQTGGRIVYGALTNEVVVNKAVTVQGVNGPAATTIRASGISFGDSAVRCVYLTNGATLAGFTITGGSTRSVSWGTVTPENCGGGVWCESTGTVISNCVFAGNTALMAGGAVYGGTLINCTIANNLCSMGGGAAFSTLTGNVGGGAYQSRLDACTIQQNSSPSGGGGVLASAGS